MDRQFHFSYRGHAYTVDMRTVYYYGEDEMISGVVYDNGVKVYQEEVSSRPLNKHNAHDVLRRYMAVREFYH